MNIVGITTCAGPIYSKLLARTLPVWCGELDRVIVVREDGGESKYSSKAWWPQSRHSWKEYDGGGYHYTDAFTRNGARFNKGLALNEGIQAANPTDWILCFDCDILPPTDLRQQIEKYARFGCINGVQRYKPNGVYEDRRWYPRGYFQLWHKDDPHAGPFNESIPHAGRYDTLHAERWPQEQWNDMRFRVTHLGERAKHWFGEGTTRAQMERAVKQAGRARGADRVS